MLEREQIGTRTASYGRELLVFLLVFTVASSLEIPLSNYKTLNLRVGQGHQSPGTSGQIFSGEPLNQIRQLKVYIG
jgi:hypothetical protein